MKAAKKMSNHELAQALEEQVCSSKDFAKGAPAIDEFMRPRNAVLQEAARRLRAIEPRILSRMEDRLYPLLLSYYQEHKGWPSPKQAADLLSRSPGLTEKYFNRLVLQGRGRWTMFGHMEVLEHNKRVELSSPVP